MTNVIETEGTDLGGESFEWMVGSSISDIVFLEPHSWRLLLSKGGKCSMDAGIWRLSTREGIVACAEDHGHPFGLPQPVDVRELALTALGQARVTSATVGEFAPDLVLRFEGGLVLELLTTSFAYECWEVADPSGRHVVVNGSRGAFTWREAPTQTEPPGVPGER